jgi:hypothetical protein
MAKRDLAACPQRGKKRESSGNTGQKQGNAVAARSIFRGADLPGQGEGRATGAGAGNRWYEPAGLQAGVPIPGRSAWVFDMGASITTS